ncbi:hypothetical protein FXB40_23950 [Bradyrhizobium rifense]|uniref:Uncharacterized protein n=1 Tax=Bradyrhizobium rifense TaxID=515499 RepID=A0A5D3KME3_9BRAD|nr:hypothetical protein [Bradyrhizobium rifense]TYL92744.1 hypothetical protein FXB40_23950 [Bradyrhizobium rifense]
MADDRTDSDREEEMTVLAGYLPQAMIIRMSAALPVYDPLGNVLQFPTAADFGFFFHEYVHFLHNISTVALLPLSIPWGCGVASELLSGTMAPALGQEHCQRTRCNI